MSSHTIGTREEWRKARLDLLEGAEYNFRAIPVAQIDPAALPIEGHGLSAFAREHGTVYHTYSAYARGCDATWAMWPWLDRAPLGRNEGDMSWFHPHDEYPA